MVDFKVYNLKITIKLPPPKGGGLVQRMAIRNEGHLKAPIYQVTIPFIKCYIVQIYHFLPYVFYCVCVPCMSMQCTPFASFRKISKIQIYFSEQHRMCTSFPEGDLPERMTSFIQAGSPLSASW